MTVIPNYRQPEIVIGLVAPTGTDLEQVTRLLKDQLSGVKYAAETIRLSGLLDALGAKTLGVELVTDQTNEFDRIRTHMDAGNALRRRSETSEILAMYAVAKIAELRTSTLSGVTNDRPYRPGTAYLLHSLKTPDEVECLRRIYGPGFFLLGVHCGLDNRKRYFKDRKHLMPEQIEALIARDEDDGGDPFGQRTRDTFHLADAFVSLDNELEPSLNRFVSLLFGDPYQSPTRDEHAMFLAFATSLRSVDLSRQVGAALFDAHNDLLSTGANDVPAPGGGQYWPGPDDRRDHVLGADANKTEIERLITDTLMRLYGSEALADSARVSELMEKLRGGLIHDITEYGRAVHAEMEALLAAARTGRSPRNATLYVTTFPCHNCAKHIIDAGVTRVVYVEPYPKSRALQLHDDAMGLDAKTPKVRFGPFIGVGPRRYFDVFSMSLGSGRRVSRKSKGKTFDWRKEPDLSPRSHCVPLDYLDLEKQTAKLVNETIASLKEAQ